MNITTTPNAAAGTLALRWPTVSSRPCTAGTMRAEHALQLAVDLAARGVLAKD